MSFVVCFFPSCIQTLGLMQCINLNCCEITKVSGQIQLSSVDPDQTGPQGAVWSEPHCMLIRATLYADQSHTVCRSEPHCMPIRATLYADQSHTVCHSSCIFWLHYCIVKPNCPNFVTIKVNRYTFRGSNSVISIFAFLLKRVYS